MKSKKPRKWADDPHAYGPPMPEKKPETITLTPRGMETQEGVERVNRAMEAQSNAIANVANLATEFIRQHGWCIDQAIDRLPNDDGDAETIREDLKELLHAIRERSKAQEEFLRAVAGAPAAAVEVMKP
jgi:hypothetical protein